MSYWERESWISDDGWERQSPFCAPAIQWVDEHLAWIRCETGFKPRSRRTRHDLIQRAVWLAHRDRAPWLDRPYGL